MQIEIKFKEQSNIYDFNLYIWFVRVFLIANNINSHIIFAYFELA